MKNEILILKVGSHQDSSTVADIFNNRFLSEFDAVELQPTVMDNSDWDAVVEKILHAEKVLTVW